MDNLNNKNIVLVVGTPATGKSTSLMHMENQSRIAYLNADLKELPFKSEFRNVDLVDPKTILAAIPQIEASEDIDSGVLDTITLLMNQFERQYVTTHRNAKGVIDTMGGWGEYSKFYSQFMTAIKGGSKNYAILAHVSDTLNEKEMVLETKVPVKGAVGKIGVEADFTTIIACKCMSVTSLEAYSNDLLTITDEEREDGYKYVFQTRITAGALGEKMRSAMGLWSRDELYIDNNLSNVFKRLNEYYN